MGATSTPIAISRRRTFRSPSHAQNATHHSSSKSAASWAQCEPVSRRVAIGKRQFRRSPPRPFPNPWGQPSHDRFPGSTTLTEAKRRLIAGFSFLGVITEVSGPGREDAKIAVRRGRNGLRNKTIFDLFAFRAKRFPAYDPQ